MELRRRSIRKTPTNAQGKGKRRMPLPQLVIVVGVMLCFAPLVSNWWAQHEAASHVSTMVSEAATFDPARAAAIIEQAQAYNARLGGYTDPAVNLDPASILPYDQQLSPSGTSEMGWLEVPRAGIKMTVFHGIEDEVLGAGVGHQPTTSLPVGGQRSKVVLSGHSGLQSFRVFDGIRVLEPGDVFAFHVLNQVVAYRVYDWQILDPEQVNLNIEDGDIAYLVTCTTTPDAFSPKGRIGINDKRLVIMAKRTAYDPNEFASTKEDISVYVNDNSRPALIAAALLIATLIASVLIRVAYTRLKHKTKED